MIRRLIAIALVYLVAVLGWMVLGGTIVSRTSSQDGELRARVGQLWGTPLSQTAPSGSLKVLRTVETEELDKETNKQVIKRSQVVDAFPVPIVKSDLKLTLHLDQRKKGLLWYATYRVELSGQYELENLADKTGDLEVSFSFPSPNGQYDDFRLELDGKRVAFSQGQGRALVATIAGAVPGKRYALGVHYVSQGLDTYVYQFAETISEARDFSLIATTDFDGFDFPANTMSPTEKKQLPGGGWELVWRYKSLVSGNGIGVAMPQKLNPGPLAARISFFAPVSLGFFFFLTFVLSILRGLRIHPMNYFFIAGAFFAFHLLLAYLVDHVSIHQAFAICSLVSVFLLLSYLRIVIGARFAFVELAAAQLVYLVGFSYAFFFEGFTGLTVTVGAIVTLFVVMQLTARINWEERFKSGA